ncbi:MULTISPECIES: hypothetical protein [Acinetobacter]|uniref:Uncharacterized protein n=2 Tax=Acinetobacter TaxID=469 RepID=N9FYI6_ACILW|nr:MULTISPECIES: hypothetical protein [Acinetobacter]ENW27702.1 hypothetical protein F923_03100 [Acinetobacter lwoffii NIPH 478]
MALKGLKREDQTSKNEKLVSDFISGASKNVQELTPSNSKFQRYTFSLTEDVSEQINDLKVRCRVAKANRSIMLKAAVSQLNTLSDEELHNLIKKELGY